MPNGLIFEKIKFAPYAYVDYPKVVRDNEGYELGTAADADEEAELLERGRANRPPVDLAKDEIAQIEGVIHVNGLAATKEQVLYIQGARAAVAQDPGAKQGAAPIPEAAEAPTQRPDGKPVRKYTRRKAA